MITAPSTALAERSLPQVFSVCTYPGRACPSTQGSRMGTMRLHIDSARQSRRFRCSGRCGLGPPPFTEASGESPSPQTIHLGQSVTIGRRGLLSQPTNGTPLARAAQLASVGCGASSIGPEVGPSLPIFSSEPNPLTIGRPPVPSVARALLVPLSLA